MSDIGQLEPGSRLKFVPVLIRAGQSLSDPLDLYGYAIRGVWMPPVFDGTILSFQAAAVLIPGPGQGLPGSFVYQNVIGSGGAELDLTVAAAQYCTLTAADQELTTSLRYIKVRAGTSGAPQAQAADRTLYLAVAFTTE